MSGLTTIGGAQIEAQFSTAAGTAQSVAFAQLFASGVTFSMLSSGGLSTVTGGVEVTQNSTGTISGAQYVVSEGGNSNFTVTSNAQVFASPGDTINATGADTLFGAVSGLTTFISSGANSSIVGSTGNLAVSASGTNSTLIGGTGTSNMTVSGAGSDAVAGPGPGTTNVTLTDTGGAQVSTNPLGNSGSLVATLSATGADTAVGGSGASTITGGGGADVFGFVNGHAGGSEVIIGYTTADNFAFEGYGYSLATPPSESYDTAGATGSDVITLTDGTTITLVGIDHKIF